MRYRYGIKPRQSPQKHKRLKFKIAEGELKGMIVLPQYSGLPGESDIEPVLQVGFFNKDKQQYDYFEPEDILTKDELINKGYELKEKRIPLIAKNDKEINVLLKILKEKGIETKPGEDIKWPEAVQKRNLVLIEGSIRIDRAIYRGFAKIAFNYLAYVAGKDFALLDDFDGIRNFIRYDMGDSNDYFGVNEPPILYHERIFNIKETSGHIIIIGWHDMNIISKVSIFNISTYQVKLCNNFNGVWRPLKSGHHFDVNSKEVDKLVAISRQLVL